MRNEGTSTASFPTNISHDHATVANMNDSDVSMRHDGTSAVNFPTNINHEHVTEANAGDSDASLRKSSTSTDVSMVDLDDTHAAEPRNEQDRYTTRYGRQTRLPRYLSDYELYPDSSTNSNPIESNSEEELATSECALINTLLIDEPQTYKQAMTSNHQDEWRQAMKEELDSLNENEVWDIVRRPTSRKVIGGKWVFKVKGKANGEIERFKARYVARGFSQVQGLDYDEIFAPVAKYDSLRLLLAIAARRKWRPKQLDIKTAFLYGHLQDEVYMELPEGEPRPDGHVAKLNRCIYGLKQSPREWYFRLTKHLQSYGYTSSAFDPCILIHNSGQMIIAIYVDDITLFGESGPLMEETVNALKSEFKVTDMGLLHWLLGIQIEFSDKGISLSQTAFIDKILARFSMQNCNPVGTPVDHNQRFHRITEKEPQADTTQYQQILGSIMYLVTGTRPDLAYASTHLSQYSSNPSASHFSAVKRLLRYVKGTKITKLFYPYEQPLVLNAFCDASHGNCLDTRRSFSGYLFQLGNSVISWRCRKQRSVATSTCEAEYMALALVTKQFIWITGAAREIISDHITSAVSTDSH